MQIGTAAGQPGIAKKETLGAMNCAAEPRAQAVVLSRHATRTNSHLDSSSAVQLCKIVGVAHQ